jgi:anhydro-N-acetylmuramic acid kinase
MALLDRNYRKTKLRKILVVSAGGEQSGIQCLYFISNNSAWEIITHSVIPYPERIGALIESARYHGITLQDLGWLDYKISLLFIEAAKAALARAPRALRQPTITVANQLSLWKGPTGESDQLTQWNMSFGDPQLLARSIGTPVVADLMRYQLLSMGGPSPTLHGNVIIARKFPGISVFLNIGLLSRMTIMDGPGGRCLLDSETGPGACLINRCAREFQHKDGFDRDGSAAAQGTVNIECLESLATSPWFLAAGPKEASSDLFDPLLQKSSLLALSPNDKLATLTALTARTVYDFFRANFKEPDQPSTVLLSGGGANNLSLVKFLATYFGRIPLQSCETLNIPLEMRIPLAMGLSVDGYFMGESDPGTDNDGAKGPIGRLCIP